MRRNTVITGIDTRLACCRALGVGEPLPPAGLAASATRTHR